MTSKNVKPIKLSKYQPPMMRKFQTLKRYHFYSHTLHYTKHTTTPIHDTNINFDGATLRREYLRCHQNIQKKNRIII